MTADKLEVTELQGSLSIAMRQAALRYADGDQDGARVALEMALDADITDRRDWLALMDLELLQGRRASHDVLVQRYLSRFGEPPPAERARAALASTLPSELRPGGPGCILLGGALDARVMPAMASIRAAAGGHVVVHIDVSRVEELDNVGCRLLGSALVDLVEAGNGIVLSGTEQLERLLRLLLQTQPEQRAAWDLLLLLLRLAGDQAAFDHEAAACALALGTTAPEWEPLLMPRLEADGAPERRAQPRYVLRDRMDLRGTIERADDVRLAELAAFAADNEYVNIQLARLERLSLPAADELARIVAAAAAAGRTVRLIRPNQLVGAILEILDLGGHAILLLERP
jgi:anti-anti-sigma regulatory factor